MFSCKGRPFTAMVSTEIESPTSMLIDFELVRDLNIKMLNLQCKKFTFAGFNMRILGQICTAAQCVKDGFVAGSFQLTATVVLDLAKNFETFSVAGKKLASQLSSPSDNKAPPSTTTPGNPSPPISPARATSSARQGRTSPSPPPKRARTSAQTGRQSPTCTSSPPKMSLPTINHPHPQSSPPPTVSHVSVRPLSSPPGFLTPMFVSFCEGCSAAEIPTFDQC